MSHNVCFIDIILTRIRSEAPEKRNRFCWWPVNVDARIRFPLRLELSDIQFVLPFPCHVINGFVSASFIPPWKTSLRCLLRITAKCKLNKTYICYNIRKTSYYSFLHRNCALFLLCYVIWISSRALSAKLRATRECEWSNKKTQGNCSLRNALESSILFI